jgi:uncharacterized membrane protein HdeD (DUF308 family)
MHVIGPRRRVMNESTGEIRRRSKLWLAILLRGIAAFVFGVAVVSKPNMPIRSLANLFAAWTLADGMLSLYLAMRASRASIRSWPLAVEAIIDCAAGVSALLFPLSAPLRLIAGVRAVLAGAAETSWALRPRVVDDSRWLIGFGGLGLAAFGVILLGWPGPGVVALPWLIGVGALVAGVFSGAGAMSEEGREARRLRAIEHPSSA